MESWEIAGRLSILDTMARYTHAGDTGRSQAFADCFTPDGVMEVIGEQTAEGRDAIYRFLEEQKASLAGAMETKLIRHFVTSHWISFESPEEASASSYFLAITHIGPDHWGRYRDRFVPVEGAWLIARRTVRVDGAAAGGWQEAHA
jgi:hypothetical protein